MKFFTDRTVENDYLLVKIKDYLKMKDFSRWKEVFVDPGVYDLVKSPRYSWEGKIKIEEFLNLLPKNHYFSFDYPCDMNEQYSTLFIEKSWKNAIKFHKYPQYICTVQCKFNHYWSFLEWFDKYNNLEIKSGILGLGNICRHFFKNEFIKHALPYAFKNCSHERVHIYGLGSRIIPFAYELSQKYNIALTIDSTKWTRACSTELKEIHGINSKASNRQLFFDTFLNILKKKGVKIKKGNIS
jgi:hypothetical protein